MMAGPYKERFIADVMLGRLSKWLRVMGYDTHYQPFYNPGMIDGLIHEGRLFLSRNRRMTKRYIPSLFVETDHVHTQLQGIIRAGYLSADHSRWFTRCLVCNTPLREVSTEEAKTHIPEYVFSQNNTGVHFCPSCGRFLWPGSHKTRMMNQISEWDLFYY